MDDDLLLGLRWIMGEISCTGDPLQALVEAFLTQSAETAARYLPGGQHGRRTGGIGPAQPRRRRHLLRAQFLRSRPAGAAHAHHQARPRRHSPHAVQILGRHWPVRRHPRAGGHILRFHPPVEPSMTAASPSPRVPTEVDKERSMLLQKQMIAGHYSALSRAPQEGRKVVYTFVPGNLTELLRSFDLLPVLPEINALQSGMRKLSGRLYRGSGEARAQRRRLHLREVRHRNAEEGQHRSHRRKAAPTGLASALLYRLFHLHEVVRTAAPGIRLPGSHAPCSVPVGRPYSASSSSTTSSSSCARR